jgi:hypothetical protein
MADERCQCDGENGYFACHVHRVRKDAHKHTWTQYRCASGELHSRCDCGETMTYTMHVCGG